MLEQITSISLDSAVSVVNDHLDILTGMFDGALSGSNHLKLVSVLLMILALILFVFLVIVLYVRSMISFLKADGKANKSNLLKEQKDAKVEDNSKLDEELERSKRYELELERELEKELELARIDDNKKQEKAVETADMANNLLQDAVKEEENTQKLKAKEHEEIAVKKETSKLNVDLDWKKDLTPEVVAQTLDVPVETLTYRQSQKELSELLGLLIDMVGRGVDDVKIAQALIYKNQGKNTEEDILQTIDSVKDFIALCLNGKFNDIISNGAPDVNTALQHLAQGDSSVALVLMENLLDSNIEKANVMSAGPKKDEIYYETSQNACTFGTLASVNDVHLATGSFELAVELAPSNVNAWSRVGDMYAKVGSNGKAEWAYNNVLKMADEEISPRQVANANEMLSQFYYSQGNNLQAAKMHNSAKHYYDNLGINHRLGKQEIEIIEIIESNQGQDIEVTIQSILANQNLRQYSYVS